MNSVFGEVSQVVSIFTVVIGGVFTAIKWLDVRKRELREKRYEKYMSLISIISGSHPDDRNVRITEQIAAIWFLLEYKEYEHLTCRIFSDNNLWAMANPPWIEHVFPHIERLLLEIKSKI